MGTTIHFPQAGTGLLTGEPGTEPVLDTASVPAAEPAASSAAEKKAPPVPRPLSGWKPAVTAALWGIAAAGVWLGCRGEAEPAGFLREGVLAAALALFSGWCGLSPAGQPGIAAAALFYALRLGGIAAGILGAEPWAELKVREAALALAPYALSLSLLLFEAADGIISTFRVARRLSGGKGAGAGKFVLRTLLRAAAAGGVWAAACGIGSGALGLNG